MYIYSEKLNKKFDTVAECEKAEKAYEKQLKAEEEKKLALKEQRAARAKEVEDAYQDAIKANNKYHELLDAFLKDYNSFHMSYNADNIDGLFKSLFRLF